MNFKRFKEKLKRFWHWFTSDNDDDVDEEDALGYYTYEWIHEG